MYVRADAVEVALEEGAREDVRGEVAVGALRAAEGNGKIEAERHPA
jgi:hypothetical protein